MTEKSKWIDRRFEYHPVQGEFPCILARLRGTPARLDEIVRLLPKEVLTQSANGGWSIQEHIGHLKDVEELLDGRIDDFIAGVETLRPADMSNKRTNERHHNEKDINALLESFRDTRHGILNRIDELDEAVIIRTAVHPRLNKPMRMIDMAFFFAEHDDHHVATILEMAKRIQ
jgi:uncharacterized damage-inducible protein DinB